MGVILRKRTRRSAVWMVRGFVSSIAMLQSVDRMAQDVGGNVFVEHYCRIFVRIVWPLERLYFSFRISEVFLPKENLKVTF